MNVPYFDLAMLKFHPPSLLFLLIALFAFHWSFVSFAQPSPGNSRALSATKDTLQPQLPPPPPGTYQLPSIDTATDHVLLDSTMQPILTDFNQSVTKLHQADGTWSGLFRHVLKVFL